MTKQPAYQCRFGLFVKLKPGVISHLPGQKRTFYFNGNKFTDIEKKMFRNLLNHQLNKAHLYCITELYDNEFANDQPDRLVLKIIENVNAGKIDRIVEKNNLGNYREFLNGYPVPDYLK